MSIGAMGLATAGGEMRKWATEDVKARFGELLGACLSEGQQMVTKQYAEVAVLVPVQEWQGMCAAARPLLKELLLSDQARTDLVLPAREPTKRRDVEPNQ